MALAPPATVVIKGLTLRLQTANKGLEWLACAVNPDVGDQQHRTGRGDFVIIGHSRNPLALVRGGCQEDYLVSKFSHITQSALERATALTDQANTEMKRGGNQAAQWLKTGVVIGAIKSGGQAVGRAAQRNPKVSISAAAVVAAGLGALGYLVYRRNRRDKALADAKARQLAQQQNAAALVNAQSDD